MRSGGSCDQRGVLRILDANGLPVRSVPLAQTVEDALVDTTDPTRIRAIYTTYRHIGGFQEGRDIVTLEELTTRRDGGGPVRRRLAVLRGSPFDDRIVQELALGAGTNGTRVIAFAQARCPRSCLTDVRAAVAAPGRDYGPLRRIGGSGSFARLDATVSSTGRPTVAWGWQDGGEAADMPWQVAVASADDQGRWKSPTRLDAGDRADRPGGDVGITAGPDGITTVVWTGVPPRADSDSGPMRAATSTADGKFPVVASGRRYRRLPLHGSALGLSTARDGTTTVLSTTPTDNGLTAIRRAPHAPRFGPIEQITEGRSATQLLVLDATSNRPSVLLSVPGFPKITRLGP